MATDEQCLMVFFWFSQRVVPDGQRDAEGEHDSGGVFGQRLRPQGRQPGRALRPRQEAPRHGQLEPLRAAPHRPHRLLRKSRSLLTRPSLTAQSRIKIGPPALDTGETWKPPQGLHWARLS